MTTAPSVNTLDIDLVRAALEPDYEVLEELGRGGMATVYRARERELDREVAIKVLPGLLSLDGDFVERFQHEARTAGKLEHPNIVPIYRVGRAGQVIYFVMKLLRGQSLAAVLRERGKLAVADVRRILIETASALGYAAKRSVVHRDIKPDNILLDSEGRCVITDFGIAKTPGGQVTAAGTSLGTPRYMSPEHAQGVPLDGRSDMYSLGVVAYQCLTGKTPFNSDDPFAVLYKHINEPLPQPELETDEQRELYGVIERMLAKKPEDRFQNADQLMAALGVEVSGPTLVSATAPTSPGLMMPTQIITTKFVSLARKLGANDKRVWAVAAGVVVLLAGAYFGFPRQRSEPAAVAPVKIPPIVLPTTLAPQRVMAQRPAPEPFSRCPRPARQFSLLVDPISPKKAGSRFSLNYDVCGLQEGVPYTAWVRLRKIQGRFSRMVGGTMKPVEQTYPELASGPRTRRNRPIDLAGASPGTYAIDVAIIATKSRRKDVTRQFEVVEK